MSGKELMVRESSQVGQVAQADKDNQVLAMWLHGRPHTTQRAYAYEIKALLTLVGKPLKATTLGTYRGTLRGWRDSAPLPRPGPLTPSSRSSPLPSAESHANTPANPHPKGANPNG